MSVKVTVKDKGPITEFPRLMASYNGTGTIIIYALTEKDNMYKAVVLHSEKEGLPVGTDCYLSKKDYVDFRGSVLLENE